MNNNFQSEQNHSFYKQLKKKKNKTNGLFMNNN